MPDILIQIGHKNTEAMTDERLNAGDAAVLRTYTGAPGEREWAERLAMLLGRQLGELGMRVSIVDCIWHADIYAHRYDLMLALHHDGGGTDSHAMASEAYRNTSEIATGIGNAFVRYWAEDYERITHIPVKQNLVNANMTHYYGWAYPRMDTPRVLIEHGNGSSAHDWASMHDHIDWIVEADVLAVKKLFEIAEPAPAVNPCDFTRETGVWLDTRFLAFWLTHGLEDLGYPIAGSTGNDGHFEPGIDVVQYTERARLELWKDGSITRGLVGRELLSARGW